MTIRLLPGLLLLVAGCSPPADDSPDVPPTKKPDVHVPSDLPDGSGPASSIVLEFEEIALDAETTGVTNLVFVPGTEDQFLVLEKDGRVLHLGLDGDGTRLLGTFTVPGVFPNSDCGLISAAFDPDFADNRFVYFGSCVAKEYSRITRHVFDPADYGLIASSEAEILRVGDPMAPKSWHNVGSIGFDENGYLWALFGEKRIDEEAQNTGTNLGTILRIVPNREPDGEGYEPAPDNPFVGDDSRSPDIYAYGLRSPWKGAIDSEGRYWVGDVGAATYEELNVVSEPGQNFAWPQWEGPCEANCTEFVQPLSYWDRSSESDYALEDPDTNPTDRRVVWVGPEYRAYGGEDRYDGRLIGRTLFGDFCAGWVRAAEIDGQQRLVYDAYAGHLDSITGIAEAPDGYLYFVTYGNCKTFPYREGRMWRAVPVD
jgi:glucose/arabinose dehydrogenase